MVGSQIGTLTIGLSFGHNLCFKYSNGMCKPILHIYVPRVFDGIRNFSIQWILTPTIILWKFRSPSGLQFPKWEPTWECVSSFPHTFLHSRKHGMWLLNFIFHPHLWLQLRLRPWQKWPYMEGRTGFIAFRWNCVKLAWAFINITLLKFLVFQIGNFDQNNHIAKGGPKRPLVIMDKSILTCPVWLGWSF